MRIAIFYLFIVSCISGSASQGLEISVMDFGAKMDGITDDTIAFQEALDALPDRGVLIVPSGEAVLSKTLLLKNKTAVIRGSGSGVTRLTWKEKGGLHLIESRTWRESAGEKAYWDVHGIAFRTTVADAGTALFADFKTSDRLNPALSVQDCRFEGDGSGYWKKSIHGHNAHIGKVSDSSFRGSDETEAHIHLSGNSTCFVIDSCHGMKSKFGVLVEGKTEGVTISKCYFVHNQYGFVLNITEGGEPMFNIMNSHASSGVYAVWIKNGRSSSIVGNALFLARCSKYKDGPPSREGIRIEGKNAKDIIVSACTVQITDKEFHDVFTGIHAIAGNGLIIANNTVSNNSSTKDDYGIVIEDKVKLPMCSGNIFHLKSDRTVVMPADNAGRN